MEIPTPEEHNPSDWQGITVLRYELIMSQWQILFFPHWFLQCAFEYVFPTGINFVFPKSSCMFRLVHLSPVSILLQLFTGMPYDT